VWSLGKAAAFRAHSFGEAIHRNPLLGFENAADANLVREMAKRKLALARADEQSPAGLALVLADDLVVVDALRIGMDAGHSCIPCRLTALEFSGNRANARLSSAATKG